jgi:hypothetical protein
MEILKFKNYKKLNESITAGDLTFTTPVKSVTEYFIENSEFAQKNNLSITKEDNTEIADTDFIVSWSLNLDLRNEFIKNIEVIISNVKGTFNFIKWGEDEDDTIPLTFDANELGFTIMSNIEITNGATVIPTDIEIDFRGKVVTIS